MFFLPSVASPELDAVKSFIANTSVVRWFRQQFPNEHRVKIFIERPQYEITTKFVGTANNFIANKSCFLSASHDAPTLKTILNIKLILEAERVKTFLFMKLNMFTLASLWCREMRFVNKSLRVNRGRRCRSRRRRESQLRTFLNCVEMSDAVRGQICWEKSTLPNVVYRSDHLGN